MCSVHMVPNGVSDDHYMFMTVLYEGRQSKCLFLSNNNMRLHTELFDARAMMRWRRSHQITFTLFGSEFTLNWPGKQKDSV